MVVGAAAGAGGRVGTAVGAGGGAAAWGGGDVGAGAVLGGAALHAASNARPAPEPKSRSALRRSIFPFTYDRVYA